MGRYVHMVDRYVDAVWCISHGGSSDLLARTIAAVIGSPNRET